MCMLFSDCQLVLFTSIPRLRHRPATDLSLLQARDADLAEQGADKGLVVQVALQMLVN